MSQYHNPVLLKESVDALFPAGTYSGAGNSRNGMPTGRDNQAGHCRSVMPAGCNGVGECFDGIYADATFGGGGHSREILSRLGPSGRLVAFDRDADALANAIDDKRFTLIHNNFRFIYNYSLIEAPEGLTAYLPTWA